MALNILNVGYDSTNYYVLADSTPKLLIDVGWSGTLAKLQHQCKRLGIPLAQIKHLLVTHYHPDHAGLAQELKQLGVKLIVVDTQQTAIPLLRTHMKPEHKYVDIDLRDNQVITLDNSRAFLSSIGIAGAIISTPGHSDDSITLILDDGAAFTGDLTNPVLILDPSEESGVSWDKIRAAGGKRIHPGHGPIWTLD
ncbi:MAG: MBL fold metallo-hydrolase [Anaerolineae bacterium]|nr:MBL fold metallo-hydrolase [Anaerolineae bacterium]